MATKERKRIIRNDNQPHELKNISGRQHVGSFRPNNMTDTPVSTGDEEIADLLDTDEDRILEHYDTHVTFSK